jgi:glutathione S-transferase
MKLYYAKPSPYARRVRVLLRERGLLSRIDEIATAPWDSPAKFSAVTPMSKVPALVLDDGTLLTESALIAAHLDGLGDVPALVPGTAMTRMLHAWGLAEGLTAAARLIAVEARRDEAQRSPTWLARQRGLPGGARGRGALATGAQLRVHRAWCGSGLSGFSLVVDRLAQRPTTPGAMVCGIRAARLDAGHRA